MAIAYGQSLHHLVGVNDIWAALAGHARRQPVDAHLADWLTEAEAGRWAHDTVKPDALIEWHEYGRRVDALLEYDRGTEALRVLVEKARAYERFQEKSGHALWVLFAFTTPGRETSARKALEHAEVPIATAVLDGVARPQDAIWLPLSGSRRIRLSELADVDKPSRALQRAAVGSSRAWRFDRYCTEEAPIEP